MKPLQIAQAKFPSAYAVTLTLAGLLPSRSAAADVVPASEDTQAVSAASEPAGPNNAEATKGNSQLSSAESPGFGGSVFVDPLGFALFGPRLGVELGAGAFTGALYGRWMSAGLLSRKLFLQGNDEFAFSYGAGLRGRYYFGAQRDGLHLGPAIEGLRVIVENDQTKLVSKSSYLVPQVEVGYRLNLSRFYIDVAAMLGYAIQVSGKVENLPGGTLAQFFSARDESNVYGSANLELGFWF